MRRKSCLTGPGLVDFAIGLASEACCKLAYHSGESRPSDKGEGGGHPDPEMRGRSPKLFFGPLGLSLI